MSIRKKKIAKLNILIKNPLVQRYFAVILIIILSVHVDLIFTLTAYLTFTIISALFAYKLIKVSGEIDIGWRIGNPIAQFKIRERNFNINIVPMGVFVNKKNITISRGRVHENIESDYHIPSYISACLTMILSSLSIFILAYWIDGWPDIESDIQTIYGFKKTEQHLYNWSDRLNFGITKIIGVNENSIADHAGLEYGDFIVSINGKTSYFDMIREAYSSNNLKITIVRDSVKYNVVLKQQQGKEQQRQRWGYSVGLCLKAYPATMVQWVKLFGKAFNQGVRPGDYITLSNWQAGGLFPGHILKSINDLNSDTLLISNKSKFGTISGNETVLKIPDSIFKQEWMNSLRINNYLHQYQPSIEESIKLTIATFIYSIIFVHAEGKQLNIEKFALRSYSSSTFWYGMKQLAAVLLNFGFLFLLLGLILLGVSKYPVIFGFFYIAFIVYILHTWFIQFKIFDHIKIFRAELVPFGEMMNLWSL